MTGSLIAIPHTTGGTEVTRHMPRHTATLVERTMYLAIDRKHLDLIRSVGLVSKGTLRSLIAKPEWQKSQDILFDLGISWFTFDEQDIPLRAQPPTNLGPNQVLLAIKIPDGHKTKRDLSGFNLAFLAPDGCPLFNEFGDYEENLAHHKKVFADYGVEFTGNLDPANVKSHIDAISEAVWTVKEESRYIIDKPIPASYVSVAGISTD